MRNAARLISLSLTIISLHFAPAHAAREMPSKVKALFTNLLLAADKTTIWPGYTPLSQPVAVHFKGKGSYLIGAATAPKGSVILKGLSQPVYFFRNEAADMVLSDFSAPYPIAGIGTVFLYNYNNKDLLDAEVIIVHEVFHFFQHSAFKDAETTPVPASTGDGLAAKYMDNLKLIWGWVKQLRFSANVSTPIKPDINDIALAYVENRLLAQALIERQNYKVLAAEFVRMREYRRKKLASRLLQHELKQERIEGTAEYAGWKSIAEHFSPMVALNNQAGMLLSPQPLANNVRRFYSPGAAQGFLLDRLGVQWKTRVQNGEDIFALMRESFPPDQSTRSVKTLLRELYSDWVKNALIAQTRELDAKREHTVTRLKKYDGWRLVLQQHESSATCYDETIELGDGGFYQEACRTELHGDGINISIDKPIIQTPREITVLLGQVPKFNISIDGLKLADIPGAAAFKELYLKTEGLTLHLRMDGRINLDKKTITVEPFDRKSP